MKKFLSAIAFIMVLVLSLGCIAACTPDTPVTDDANKVL